MTTIKDIAKIANVSIATVSHVINKTRYVSPELVKRVQDAVDSLDEVPNFIKKKQRESRISYKTIVIYIPNFKTSFYSLFLKYIMKSIDSDENVMFMPIQYNNLKDKIKEVNSDVFHKVDGQIIFLDDTSQKKISQKSIQIPTLFIGKDDCDKANDNMIVTDYKKKAYIATNHLIKNGHNNISFVDSSVNNNLFSGYKESLSQNNIDLDSTYSLTGNFNSDDLNNFLKRILLANIPSSALITSIDSLMPILNFIKKHNIESPQDISIISLQDDDWLECCSPEITAVNTDLESLIKEIYQFIQQIDNNKLFIPIKHTLKNQLITRSSTGGIGRGPFGEKAASVSSLELTEKEIQLISNQQKTAVISFHYTGASWMALHEKAIREIFNQLNIDIIGITDAHFDANLQNKQLNSLLALEPDIFIAIPTDNDKTSEAFKKISETDTKLILITNVPKGLNSSDYITVVSVNEHSHGRLVASGLGDNLRNINKKNIAFLSHNSNFYATTQRDNSARQLLLEEYPDLNIVVEKSFESEEQLYKITLDLIKRFPEINGIYVSWDDPAKEVLRALQDIDREDIILSTADLDYSLAINMAEEGNVKSISAQQPYEQGRAIALAAAKAVLETPIPTFIGIEPLKVDKDNLLSVWKNIYKENPPKELQKILST